MFVERENGLVIGVFGRLQPGYAEEELPDSHPDIVAFLERRQLRSTLVEEISDRQFFHALALSSLITEAEALAAVKTGDMPATIENFILSLPAVDQFGARMLLEGATIFKRSHPLTASFGSMYGMTPAEIDALWSQAALL